MTHDEWLEAPYVAAGEAEARIEAAAEQARRDLTDEWLSDGVAFAALLRYPEQFLGRAGRWLKSRAVERVAELTPELGEAQATHVAHAAAVQDLDGAEFFDLVAEELS